MYSNKRNHFNLCKTNKLSLSLKQAFWKPEFNKSTYGFLSLIKEHKSIFTDPI